LNELRPGTVADLQQLMIGEAYPVTSHFAPYLEFLTDDIASNAPTRAIDQSGLLKGEGPYLWRHDMFESMAEQRLPNSNSYELYYRRVKVCNVVLDYVDRVIGSADEKAKAKGEALALRAYYYFMLVNLHGQPYNAAGVDINTSPGVPLILSSTVTDDYPERASVGAVYACIEQDLLEAERLLVELGKSNSKWRVTDLFVYTLLSRLYLYEEKWEASITYATKVIQRSPLLVDLCKITNSAGTNFAITNSFTSNVYDINGVETIWVFSNFLEYAFSINANAMPAYSSTAPAPYAVSPGLLACYDYVDAMAASTKRKDLRPHFYYFGEGPMTATGRYRTHGLKSIKQGNSDPSKGMRVAESYLNRAEGHARLFLATGDEARRAAALADLNYLRFHRYDRRHEEYTPVDIAAADELLQFCLDERRRELSYEEHRWFDLRRYGMPKITHVFQVTKEQAAEEYTLEQGDPRYVLPIPAVALENNPRLTPNPSNTPR
jgi:hypothetical protein